MLGRGLGTGNTSLTVPEGNWAEAGGEERGEEKTSRTCKEIFTLGCA